MDKPEFRARLKASGLTCDQFAALIGRSVSTVYDFGGRYPVPYFARTYLRLVEERGGFYGLIDLNGHGNHHHREKSIYRTQGNP